MASDIDIASNALVLLGHTPISSFTEPGAGALVAANLYEGIVINALSEHYWRFATKKQKLNQLVEKPLNQYEFAYQVPTDMIIAITVRPFSDYQIFGDLLFSNINDIDLDYVARVNETEMPPYFTKLLEYWCASDFAISVTNDNEKMKQFTLAYRDQLAHARSIDSRNTPPVPIQHQPFTDVRFSGTFFGNN